jgi:hypothetical protein
MLRSGLLGLRRVAWQHVSAAVSWMRSELDACWARDWRSVLKCWLEMLWTTAVVDLDDESFDGWMTRHSSLSPSGGRGGG